MRFPLKSPSICLDQGGRPALMVSEDSTLSASEIHSNLGKVSPTDSVPYLATQATENVSELCQASIPSRSEQSLC